jgi:hypothetical protein
MSLIRKFINFIRKNERGNITIETIYVVPLIMWTTLAFAMAWEYYRAVNTAQRATFVVADIISRERVSITDNFITAKYLRTFAFVNGLPTNTNTLKNTLYPAAIRVTSIELPITSTTGSMSSLKVLWSMSSNKSKLALHTDSSIQSIVSSIPIVLPGDSIVIVETIMDWTPRITGRQADMGPIDDNAGWVSAQTIKVLTTIRPRFVPKLCATTIVNNIPVVLPCEL